MPYLMSCQRTGNPTCNFKGSPLKFFGVIESSIRRAQQVWSTAGVNGE